MRACARPNNACARCRPSDVAATIREQASTRAAAGRFVQAWRERRLRMNRRGRGGEYAERKDYSGSIHDVHSVIRPLTGTNAAKMAPDPRLGTTLRKAQVAVEPRSLRGRTWPRQDAFSPAQGSERYGCAFLLPPS